jgi:hypothetical protein
MYVLAQYSGRVIDPGRVIAIPMRVFALGSWRRIGWRISALAACIFAIGQRKSEAVVWISAMPEFLVFLFLLLGFLIFVHWLQSGRAWAYPATLVCFLAALLSKESAVALIPLCAVAVILERRWTKLWNVLPLACTTNIPIDGRVDDLRPPSMHELRV